MVTFIDSISNPKVKHAVKIASSSSYRKECGEFFLEGLRLCLDAAVNSVKITSVFYTEKALEKSEKEISDIADVSENTYVVSQPVSDKLSQTQSSQGVFCLCRIEKRSEASLAEGAKYIALDNVQNPDNLGAVSRTAEALGIKGLIISGGCDIYNPKALRASMGSLLRLDVMKAPMLSSYLSEAKEKGVKVYATTPDSSASDITKADMSGTVICVIGNEANGVCDEVFAVCDKVTIKMLGRAESLNAAMAAAITMWEMMKE